MKLDGLSRELIARRASRELIDGEYVNLGLGIPEHVSNWTRDKDITLHSEVGMLNLGPVTSGDDCNLFTLTPGCDQVTELAGSVFFDSVESFEMIRGGYIDVTIMGAFQVDGEGSFAGWANPSRAASGIGNIGGAMDLAAGARRLIITMTHTTRDAQPKLVRKLTYPPTCRHCVDLIITNLAVISVSPEGLTLAEIYPGYSAADIQAVTGPKLIISPALREMEL